MAREETRDALLSTIQQQVADNMAFMQASQIQNARSLNTIMESQLAFQNQQHRQQTSFATHFQLMEATQTTNAALTERMAQFSLDRDRCRRSRRRRSGRSPQDGEGTSGPH